MLCRRGTLLPVSQTAISNCELIGPGGECVGALGRRRHSEGSELLSDGDLHQFRAVGTLPRSEVILDRLEVELDGFADVCEPVLAGVALTDIAGQARDDDCVAPVVARFQHDAELHGPSLIHVYSACKLAARPEGLRVVRDVREVRVIRHPAHPESARRDRGQQRAGDHQRREPAPFHSRLARARHGQRRLDVA